MFIVYNNWITENLRNRITNPNSDYRVQLKPYKFKEKTFLEATDEVCEAIDKRFNNLFLAYSGGLDSEYVLRSFHRNGIKITPIIVCCGNEHENEYAYETCEELGIEYIKVEVSETFLFNWYSTKIHNLYNGVGINSTQVLFAADVVKNKYENGTLIIGDNFLGDGDNPIEEEYYAQSSEWDAYVSNLYTSLNIIPFYMYTPELTYSMFPKENDFWNDYKAKLYGLPNRRKLRPLYSDDLLYKINTLDRTVSQVKRTHYWTKEQIFKIFDSCKE
jgi:hypothetical protein